MPLRCEDATDSRTGSGPRSSARLSARVTVISLVIVVLGLAGVAVASTLTTGEVGPSLRLTANGRLLHPAGRLTTVGNFPTGSAVAAGGHALWVTDCGHGEDDVKVVNLSSGKVIQTLPLPGCYGGVTLAPDGGTAYVGGLPKGSSPTEGPTKGDQGDVVHVFTVNPRTGTGTERSPIGLPATTGGGGRRQLAPAGVRRRYRAARGHRGVAERALPRRCAQRRRSGGRRRSAYGNAASCERRLVPEWSRLRPRRERVRVQRVQRHGVCDRPDECEGDRDDQRSRRQPRRPRKPPGGDGRGPASGATSTSRLRTGTSSRSSAPPARPCRSSSPLLGRRGSGRHRSSSRSPPTMPRSTPPIPGRTRSPRSRSRSAPRRSHCASGVCICRRRSGRSRRTTSSASGSPNIRRPATTAGCSPSSIVTCACARRGAAQDRRASRSWRT